MNYIFDNEEYKNKLLERFLRYVKIWTESDGAAADKGIFPSTQRQFDLARLLEGELKALGLQEVQVTDDCYVYGYLPASKAVPAVTAASKAGAEPVEGTILLLAHMDTVDEVTGKDVHPVLSQKGEDTIIHSDGTTLLGGDDKAGISAIMECLEYLLLHPELPHCPLEVIFSPDEETGHGMDKVPLGLIKSKYAYTVDGGAEGELESECFNAWSCRADFYGKACHTGDAKALGMINAALMAGDFVSKLPHDKLPETTEDHEGFIALMEMKGTIEKASAQFLLRAFSIEEIEAEKRLLERNANEIMKKYGGKVELSFHQQYLNMKDELDKHPQVLQRLEKAYQAAGVQIIRKPIRGGTDGSRLTEMGIPTPNIFTGGHEFHSRNEWVSLNSMARCTDVLISLVCTEK